MPYIKRERRAHLDPHLRALRGVLDELDAEPGDLNYCITQLVLTGLPTSPRYADYNAAIGVLEGAKLELYRGQIAHYEDAAKVHNGPLNPPQPPIEAQRCEAQTWTTPVLRCSRAKGHIENHQWYDPTEVDA